MDRGVISGVRIDKEALSTLRIISHPLRYAILKKLGEVEALDLSDIRSVFGMDKKVVRFHLWKLERSKLVCSFLEKRGDAVTRVFCITPLGKMVLDRISSLLSDWEAEKRCMTRHRSAG